MNRVYYKEGYLYQVDMPYREKVNIKPDHDIKLRFLNLSVEGDLEILPGYAHDGPSGPCKFIANHLPSFLKKRYLKCLIRGATKHDAFYQMMRMGELPISMREAIDQELRDDCLKDGMTKVRAWGIYTGVHKGAAFAAKKDAMRKQLVAP